MSPSGSMICLCIRRRPSGNEMMKVLIRAIIGAAAFPD